MNLLTQRFFLLVVITLGFSSCKSDLVKGYGGKSTSSVAESKKIGVFLKEYQPVHYKLNDSIECNIHEAYAEKIFYYNDTIDEWKILLHTEVTKFYEDYDENALWYWYVEDFWNTEGWGNPSIKKSIKNVTLSDGGLLNTTIPPDTLKIEIMTARYKDENSSYSTLKVGEFYLYAKQGRGNVSD